MENISWMTLMGFAFLTFNSAMAVYRSNGDPGSVVFVIASYADLVTLFVCLRWYEKADPDSRLRGVLKTAIWVLTAALTLMFSYKVAEIMPLPVKIIVWVMAAATTCGGFYAFFIYSEKGMPVAISDDASK